MKKVVVYINPIALRKAKTVYNFGLSEYNRVKHLLLRKMFATEQHCT